MSKIEQPHNIPRFLFGIADDGSELKEERATAKKIAKHLMLLKHIKEPMLMTFVECFYIHNLDGVRGQKGLDLSASPPPDLVVEIDATSSLRERLQVYQDLGVVEARADFRQGLTIPQDTPASPTLKAFLTFPPCPNTVVIGKLFAPPPGDGFQT